MPLNIIKQNILDLFKADATVDEVVAFLDSHLLVCVVTQEEDRKLSEYGYKTKLGAELNKDTVWNRYKCSFITVCNVKVERVGRKDFIKVDNILEI